MIKNSLILKKRILIFLFLLIPFILCGIFNCCETKKVNENIVHNKKFFDSITKDALNESYKQADNLSFYEKESILKYIDDKNYRRINGYLRKETLNIDYDLKNDIKNIECALNKAFLPDDTLLYRSVKEDFIEKVFFDKKIANLMKRYPSRNYKNLKKVNSFLTGKAFVEFGFMSTSYNAYLTYASPIKLKVNAPKGTKALALDSISTSEEEEILINRCSIWKITDVDYAKMGNKTIWEVTLEAIPKVSNSVSLCSK